MMKHVLRIICSGAIAAALYGCNEATPPPAGRAAAAPVPLQEPAQDPARALFEERCQDCHKLRGRGGDAGPDLSSVSGHANDDYVESVICDPRSHFPGTGMPSFEGRLTEKQIRALAEYVCEGK